MVCSFRDHDGNPTILKRTKDVIEIRSFRSAFPLSARNISWIGTVAIAKTIEP